MTRHRNQQCGNFLRRTGLLRIQAVIVPTGEQLGIGGSDFAVENIEKFPEPFGFIEIGIVKAADAYAQVIRGRNALLYNSSTLKRYSTILPDIFTGALQIKWVS